MSSATKNSLFLWLLFAGIVAAIVAIGDGYKSAKIEAYKADIYAGLADSMRNEVAILIEEKKNATLAIALSLAGHDGLRKALLRQVPCRYPIQQLSQNYQARTDFKNVWIQLLDPSGRSYCRSWSEKSGDDLSGIREEIKGVIRRPEPLTSISVGRYDMTFKAMVPIYSDAQQLLGFLDIITHFNSIASKLSSKGFRPIILVDPRYKLQIQHPFTGKFAGDHYVANIDADERLIKQIATRGLAPLISLHSNYVLDAESESLVINYAMFDPEQRPMANFLLFRPLKEIKLDSLPGIVLTIYLVMGIAIVMVALLLHLILRRSQERGALPRVGEWQQRTVYLLLFVILSLLFSAGLQWWQRVRTGDHLAAHNHDMLTHFKMIQGKYGAIANTFYQASLNRPQVLALMQAAQGTAQAKEEARSQLLQLLASDYEYFRRYGLKQLHFHLPDNESFLRFHRPQRFGDNLSAVRTTVAWVNRNRQPIEGFEEGRIYNGFRYVFPLITDGPTGNKQHLGSVETSFSAFAMAKEMAQSAERRVGFLIRADVVDEKVFSEERGNYIPSEFPGFYYEGEVKKRLEHDFEHIDTSLLQGQQRQELANRIDAGDPFTLAVDRGRTLFTVIPVANPLSEKIVAALVLQSKDALLANQANNLMVLWLTGEVAIMLLMLFLQRESSSKSKIRSLLDKTQNILDAQESIVIITDGTKLLHCNRKLVDFLGYPSLAAFRQRHDCLCDHFIRDDSYFHLGKVPEGDNWVTYLDQLPRREHVVAMLDSQGHTHSFAVTISKYAEDYVISFSDISETMKEHFSLAERVLRDKLTGAFNREYFATRIEVFRQEALQEERQAGLLMFDVDHFKAINDRYGHPSGDQVLMILVELIKGGVRQEDSLIRWGGEEFMLLVKSDSLAHLQALADKLRQKIERQSFDGVGKVTCSFGVTILEETESVPTAIARVDRALYQAKNNGRNQVVVGVETSIS